MISTFQRQNRDVVQALISQRIYASLNLKEKMMFDRCIALADTVWTGFINDNLACVWGLIPPSFLSDRAYLWLYATEEIEQHKFIFIRNSQLAVEEMLEEYPVIYGDTEVSNTRAIQWIKWLGGKFGEPQGSVIPFEIRRQHG